MLKLFSRMERTRNWVIIIFALLMGLSLVLFYANPGRNANAVAATNTEVLARVGGDEITVADLNRIKDSWQQRFGGQISLAQLGGDTRFLDGLIRDRIIAQEAMRLGLGASDAEVAQEIRKQFSDESGNFVGMDRYREILSSRGETVDHYERQVRDSIAAQKLQAFVTAGVNVSDEEVQNDYKRKNTSLDLIYVPVSAEKVAARIQPSDDDLQKFYDEHKTEFRFFEPQKKIRYLYIDQAKVGEKLNISDADLKAEYDQLSPENKQAGVRVQQIVFKVASRALDQQVSQKANELVTQLRGDAQTVPEDKFAEAARGKSEDPATAPKGGWLPNPVRKNVSNPKDFVASHTLNLEEGQVTDPVENGNAYYIFRRGPAVPKTFEEAKPELLASLRNRRAYKSAADLAERAAARLKEVKDVQKVAQELAGEANMSAADMVKETPLIKPGDDVPGIGSSPQFEDAIKPLENQNDIGDRVSIKGGFAIPMLIEKRDPRIPDLAEVKDKVAQRVKNERAKTQLEQTARELANNANNASNLKAAAEKLGLEAKTAEKYKLGTPLGEAGTSPAADDVIYNLKEGEVTKTPIKVGDSWVVVGAMKRTEADLTEFAKQREQLTESMLSSRRSDVFEDYVSASRARFEREGKIKIYQDVLARAKTEEEDEPAAAPRTIPRGLSIPVKK